MKGSMFSVFEAFVVESFGVEVFEQALDTATLQTTEPFVGPGTYPAEDLLALVATTCQIVGVEVDDAVRAFGKFAFAHLARSVPHAMESVAHPLDFLTHLESVIHTEVRKLDPMANPPRIELTPVDDRTTVLHYHSPLGLVALVSGLLDGVGEWFGVPFDHELLGHEGEVATFRLTFAETRASSVSAEGASVAGHL